MVYSTKRIGGIVKDVDTVKGIIVGYFASIGTLDSDGDIFDKGCFDKTIKENSARIMHLLQHNTQMPLARPELSVDNYGLKFISTITQTSYGLDTIKLYADGVYKEHSVGFEPLQNEVERDGNHITEVKLWEGSTVTWGANENTPVESVKKLNLEERVKYVTERSGLIRKSLHRGNYTDNTYNLLEIELKQLESYLAVQPPISTVPADEIEKDILEKMLMKTLNLKYSINGN